VANSFGIRSGKLIECHGDDFGKLIQCHAGEPSKCHVVNFFINIHNNNTYAELIALG